MTSPALTTVRVRALNDAFRTAGPLFGHITFEGLWLVTAGVQTKGPAFVHQAMGITRRFNAFTLDNDPHGEHDFGSFLIGTERVFWKIDYLQRGTPYGAEDPANNATTCRMITIMLAGEW
jgi:hypothetical protein